MISLDREVSRTHLDPTVAWRDDPEQDPEEPVSGAAPEVVQRVEEEANSKDKPS